MKKIFNLLLVLLGIVVLTNCTKPEEDFVFPLSQDTRITRFRIYKNVNEFYDASISHEDSTIRLLLPLDMDLKQSPELIISENAVVSPKSGEEQDFSMPIIYTVTAEDGIHTRKYNVIVSH